MTTNLNVALERLQTIWRDIVATLPNVLIALVVLLIFWVISRVIRRLVERVWSFQEGNIGTLFGRLAAGSVFVFGVLVCLTIIFPSVTPASLFSLLGVGGVAIGFAFRDILQNLLAGVILLLTRPFRIGDQIVVDKFEGTVEDIQVRATIVRTYDNLQVVIPNTRLFTGEVTVNTAYEMRRLEYDVGIGYGDDIDTAKRVIYEALKGLERVRQDPIPEVLVMDLAESFGEPRRGASERQRGTARRRDRSAFSHSASAFSRPDRGIGRQTRATTRGLARWSWSDTPAALAGSRRERLLVKLQILIARCIRCVTKSSVFATLKSAKQTRATRA